MILQNIFDESQILGVSRILQYSYTALKYQNSLRILNVVITNYNISLNFLKIQLILEKILYSNIFKFFEKFWFYNKKYLKI